MGAKVSFNEITKIITVTLTPVDGEVFIDVKADLYSDGKEDWVANENLRKFTFPITSVAGNPLPGSKELGPTFFIASDWKIRPYEASHKLTVNGNLYAVDGSDPFLDTLGNYTVRIMQQVSSLVDSTIAQLPEIEYASFGGGVSVDIDSGSPGVKYPVGTQAFPSDNLVDTVAIANTRGFNVLFIKGNITLSNTVNLQDFTIKGESIVKTKITIQPAALVFGTEFVDAIITGTLDGDNTAHHCAIQTLDYVQGHIHNCLLEEYTITLAGSEDTILLNCWSGGAAQDVTPVINMGGSGRNLIIRGHSGGLKITNKTGPEDATLDFESGRVIIDSTVTAGNVTIRGIGQVVDNSTGTTEVDTSGVMSKRTITEIGWGAVYIDTDNGSLGADFPIGTSSKPAKLMSDAISIADSNNIRIFKIRGSITLPQTFDSWTFIGIGSLFEDTINLNSQSIDGCRFESLTVSGITTTTDSQWVSCNLYNVSGLSGLLINCALKGSIAMGGVGSTLTGQNIGVYGSTPGAPAVVDMIGTGRVFQASMDGALQFSNAAAGSYIEIGLKNGIVILDSTCVGGTASFTGVGDLINYSAMTIQDKLLTESSISDGVLDELVPEHTIDGSLGDHISRILGVTEIKRAKINDLAASTTKFITNLTETTNTFWDRSSILFGGQNSGQIRAIKNYNGGTKEIQLQTPLSFIPADQDDFVIVPARKFLTPDVGELADAVWVHASAEFMLKVIKNKKSLVKSGSVWGLIIYDDDDITPILNKEMKDKDGNNITDLAAGVLARELKNTV